MLFPRPLQCRGVVLRIRLVCVLRRLFRPRPESPVGCGLGCLPGFLAGRHRGSGNYPPGVRKRPQSRRDPARAGNATGDPVAGVPGPLPYVSGYHAGTAVHWAGACPAPCPQHGLGGCQGRRAPRAAVLPVRFSGRAGDVRGGGADTGPTGGRRGLRPVAVLCRLRARGGRVRRTQGALSSAPASAP